MVDHAKLARFFLLVLAISLLSDHLKTEALRQTDMIPEFESSVSGVLSDAVAERLRYKIADQPRFHHKVVVASKSRKVLEDEMLQPDYDYAGPNPKHDPRRGRGGKSR